MIHDWVGAVFIAQATLKDVLQVVGDYARYKNFYAPTVIDSKVIATGEAQDRFSMVLVNKALFLRTALDIDYETRYVQIDERRGYNVSHTTRLQEIEEYGAPSQRALREGEGYGIVWRLASIARYVQRDGGVYFELEAMGLSRDVSASLRWLGRTDRAPCFASLTLDVSSTNRKRSACTGRTRHSPDLDWGSVAVTARGRTASQDLHATH